MTLVHNIREYKYSHSSAIEAVANIFHSKYSCFGTHLTPSTSDLIHYMPTKQKVITIVN